MMPEQPSQAPAPPSPTPPYATPPPPAYPPPAYAGLGAPGPGPYRGPMLPAWLTFGGIIILVGGILVLVGFLVDAFGAAAYASSTATNAYVSYLNSQEAFAALVGLGAFLVVLGWLFHQMSLHRPWPH